MHTRKSVEMAPIRGVNKDKVSKKSSYGKEILEAICEELRDLTIRMETMEVV